MSFLNNLYRDTQTTQDGRVSGRGLGAFLLNPFVDEQALNRDAQRTLNQQTAIRGGESLADLGIDGSTASTYDVEGAIIRRGRERQKETKKDDLRDSMAILSAQQAPQLEEMRATNRRLLQQGNQQHQLALMQMADSKDQRAMELEYMKARDRKEDMRYNERMEQLDRKDRRMAMQSLAAGLASLGAAFAL